MTTEVRPKYSNNAWELVSEVRSQPTPNPSQEGKLEVIFVTGMREQPSKNISP
ncbi:hypothetical protein [Okeania sp. SIO2C2]|uniref:hypothetical protein n=1 Tax=Okeania sp. SIO2C2 TaxID=2607787 RepID=UPI0025798A3D|nr:hypothetical protein [Okeania sp. SIO2C2]